MRPSPLVVVDSDDVGSGGQDVSPSPERPHSAESMDSAPAAPVPVPSGLLDAPPGLPPPTCTPKADPAAAPGL
jgi:CCR4-NOT transcription complex subunit 4